MNVFSTLRLVMAGLIVLTVAGIGEVHAQWTHQWLDIGEYQSRYTESGATSEGQTANEGSRWPAILRYSDHLRAKAFWIGVRNFTDSEGTNHSYYVARVGPRPSGVGYTYPIQNRVIAKFEDATVEVDGIASFSTIAIVDEVDPAIPADRMVHNIFNMSVGVTVDRKVYAWQNEFHDQYHLIEHVYTNTGNVDDDEEIELDGQNLEDVYFFRMERYRGNEQEGEITGGGQQWGKYNMIDVVGDGNGQDYGTDFTATYSWPGWRSDFTRYNNLGGSIWEDGSSFVAPGDSVGRLAGGSFVGTITLHADASPTDQTYDRAQPSTMGFIDTDEPLNADGSSEDEYYNNGILTREAIPRMFPHYADRVEPSGRFDINTTDASTGKQGGHANTTAFGPYQLAFGESIRVVYAESAAGLSYDARRQVGIAYKRSGGNDNLVISYDANGDGTINDIPDYDPMQNNGDETLTKNQWVLSARDSLFKQFTLARANFLAMTDNVEGGPIVRYAIPEAPYPPTLFTVTGRPDRVELRWTPQTGGPAITGWQLWRTNRFTDNLPYQLIAELPPSATEYDDTALVRGVDYYYHLQAVGEAQPVDEMGITGTPAGLPLRSSQYFTQTYSPVNLKRPPGASIEAARVVPNPVNVGSDDTIRFAKEDEVAFFNIPGNCTITIFTEIGEEVQVIEHTDGSGDEKWNLTTSARQLLVSGIYIAHIRDNDTGAEVFRKFTVIR